MSFFKTIFGDLPPVIVTDDPRPRLPTDSSPLGGLGLPGTPGGEMVQSFIDNVLRDKVAEPALGNVVYCDLVSGYAKHSRIYVGGGEVVHLDGSGRIEKVLACIFMSRLGGFNTAFSIHVSCCNRAPVGMEAAARRALSMVGRTRDYNVLLDNCHQFTAGCPTGEFENSANFMSLFKPVAEQELIANEWLVWDR